MAHPSELWPYPRQPLTLAGRGYRMLPNGRSDVPQAQPNTPPRWMAQPTAQPPSQALTLEDLGL